MGVKKTAALAVLASMMTVLGACSSGGGDTSASAPGGQAGAGASAAKPGDKVELVVAWWGSQNRHDRTLKVIDLFQSKYPNVKITPQYSGSGGYWDKLTTQLAAGNAPDVIQFGGNLSEFIGRGVVLPLDPYVGKTLNLADHDKALVDAATVDGKLYAVSLGSNARAMFINKTLLQKAGLDMPAKEWTWDDLKTMGAKISSSLGKGVYALSDFGEDLNGFEYFLNQRGKRLHTNGVFGFDKQDALDWFALWDGFRKDGVVPPAELQATENSEPTKSLLVTGKVVMSMYPSNTFETFQAAMKDELAMHVIPYGKNGHGVPLRPSQFMAGYAKTKHPEEVARFIDFMVNDPEAVGILGSERGIPQSAKAREQLKAATNDIDKKVYDYVDWVSKTSKAPFVPDLPGYTESTKLFQVTNQKIAFKQLPLEKAVDEFWTELNKINQKATK